jgi:DNA segregation ATPase FtsK/SpoIIIE, S-DNA-T family
MRSTRQPPIFLPDEHDRTPMEFSRQALTALPLRHVHGVSGETWNTPWAAAGLPEPGWWKAFMVGKNVVSTRTPSRLGRKPDEEPKEEPELAHPTPRSQAPKRRLPAPQPQQDSAVRSQIAKIRAEFESELAATSAPSVEPTAVEASSAKDTKKQVPQTEGGEGSSAKQVANDSMIVTSRLQSVLLGRPITMNFAWEPSSYQVVAVGSENPSKSPEQACEPVQIPYNPGGPAVAMASVPLTAALEAEDVDLGYLSLYMDELPISTKTVPEQVAGKALIAAPFKAIEPSNTLKAVAGVEMADGAKPQLEPHEVVPDIDEDMELPPFVEADITTEMETFSSVPEQPEVKTESETHVEAEAELDPVLPSAEIIMLPRPAPQREIFAAYQLPDIEFLAEPPEPEGTVITEDVLEEAAGRLEKVIRDFGVKGEVVHVHPGPVVTLYEFEPAPGIKSSRVIALSDDIARSMSAISARVAVIPGRNVIGIELPNQGRETVYLRELLVSGNFETSTQKMPVCLGKTIGGEPVIVDLARMPHLLMAGTTGSGKSVAINTMILSLLYRFKPEECRLIMVDPKMLELSVYDGIPHLLTPVVTDPKKAIIALRWAVREMEDRYKKMAKMGVRNIDGFNSRVAEAKAKGEVITRSVQTGFDKETGQPVYADEVMDLSSLPYIVVIVDEMADLMMVAGKEIEGAIQRLAQMARAAGIHVILATQRPSVDVITGTIKANFPTRISFQVTSKIDSRTILGEMGAEQLLGQGDMLHMAGGGRIERVHGPFCSDEEVEKVVAHLKRQAKPVYLEAVTADDEDEEDEVEDLSIVEEEEMGLASGDLYDQAVSIILRHKKASTSYIQRRLQIGYNRAASIMERMEKEGVVGPANHAGKREILIGPDGFDDD